MMSRANHRMIRQSRKGFTLLEVLLAVTILGLLTTSIYTTWNAALKAWKRGSDVSETFQRQRIVLDTLTKLAESAIFFNSSPELYEVIGDVDSQTGASVSFVTASDVLLPQAESLAAGMRRVTISMERDLSGQTYLGISNYPALEASDTEPTGTMHVLSADVVGFYVRYRDPRNATWSDDWHETDVLPSAMEFTVVFGQKGARIPPIVVTRAIEIPIAEFAMITGGKGFSQQNTTNEVTRRDVNLSELQSDQGAGMER